MNNDDPQNSQMDITFQAIGLIHSPFKDLEAMPIQPASKASGPGRVEIFPEYQDGLKDLDGFSHIILLYHMHATREHSLTVTPFLDTSPRGLFATRAPARPNPIGLSIVNLIRVEGGVLYVDDLDVLDGTPLLDLKPYVPEFDHRPDARIGWLEKASGEVKGKTSDNRFR
ncbi:MAG: S-adenosyl-L-methionine-binding protein [Candidatus Methanophagaceae archaeon]|jgi:tRNA-Thr(GGU) m(6)t(6)A37 methyltransferase TsaA|nr:MAG: S-adenosyl-L-methionine-binding protein [Methanophagales archaeon]KAF5434350.1 tRNA (Thr-GGU) A37 N-methylase [Methanophagales archaeon]